MIPVSILDLSPIVEGGSPALSFRNTLDLAQHAETWGYQRFWIAEHHNLDGVASSATSVLIGHVAGGTKTLRVGSGGIMLPNHAPLVIAEHFGTLATLYPGRIELGLGRAPGTDRVTMQALRRTLAHDDEDGFPRDVMELMALFDDVQPGQQVRAIPGMGTHVPIWLLGSSTYSAQLAAYLGLPFSFASHFAPDYLMHALRAYRDTFRPSAHLQKPYASVGMNVVIADTDEEAAFHFTSLQMRFLGMQRNRRGPVAKPVTPAELDKIWSPHERAGVERMMACSTHGSPAKVKRELAMFIERTQADELIVACAVHSHEAKLRSYELLAQVARELEPAPVAVAT